MLLYLPGMLTDQRLWQHQVPALHALMPYQHIRLDTCDNLHRMADDLLQSLPHDKPFVLCGLSMGGLYRAGSMPTIVRTRAMASVACADTDSHLCPR